MTSPTTAPATKPKIVCLCGSTRFWREYQRANQIETLAGHIVLSVGFFVHQPATKPLHEGEMLTVTPCEKAFLDELHLRKIDLADEILVLNVANYIGESTRAEIAYGEELGKPVRYWEPLKGGAA